MNRLVGLGLVAGALAAGAPALADAQQPAAPQASYLRVGQMAPDFEVAGATRYGVLQSPVKLSSFRGNTVVLSWFFRARTRG